MNIAHKVDNDFVIKVLDKAESGPLIEEKEWDQRYIYQTIQELIARYDIHWDRNSTAVPSDDALADRVYAAGFELACRSGVYCIDSHRRMV